MGIVDKARELGGQVVEKAGDLGGDDVIANIIIRAGEKKDRVNKVLADKGSQYRIVGIEVEAGIPPKTVFSVGNESEIN